MANWRLPTTNRELAIANHQPRIGDCQYQWQISDCPSLIANWRLPTTDGKLAIANYQWQIGDCPSPIANW
jgi:hypothetical protein